MKTDTEADAWFEFALVLEQQGKYAEALEALSIAIEMQAAVS